MTNPRSRESGNRCDGLAALSNMLATCAYILICCAVLITCDSPAETRHIGGFRIGKDIRIFNVAVDHESERYLLQARSNRGLDLASQPTLSRFENAAEARDLYRMGETLATGVIERHAKRLGNCARLVTIDLDPTNDPTHGAQQMSFFNGHCDSWCYPIKH